MCNFVIHPQTVISPSSTKVVRPPHSLESVQCPTLLMRTEISFICLKSWPSTAVLVASTFGFMFLYPLCQLCHTHWGQRAIIMSNHKVIERTCKNEGKNYIIARGTTDPGIASKYSNDFYSQICIGYKFGHLMASLALVPNLVTRWHHMH